MEERANINRVAVRTKSAIEDTDGYKKTELYFTSYDNGKCFRGIKEIIHEKEVEYEIEEPVIIENNGEEYIGNTKLVKKKRIEYTTEEIPNLVLELDPKNVIEVISF